MTRDESDVPEVGELFDLLGDDRRIRILWALWDSFDADAYVVESRDAMPFKTLRQRAGVDDSGNFNYHLGKLTGVLLEHREGGYVLTPLGYNLMRSLDEYAAFESEDREEWVTGESCPFCGGDLVSEYRREILGIRCRDCRGIVDDGDFWFVRLHSISAEHLDDKALLDAGALAMFSRTRSSLYGVCWHCRGPMTHSIELCSNHETTPGGVCETCSRRFRVHVHTNCEHCSTHGIWPSLAFVAASHTVSAAFERVGNGPLGVGPWAYQVAVLGAATETVVGTDPVRVRIDVDVGDETHCVTVEERDSGLVVDTERGERVSLE